MIRFGQSRKSIPNTLRLTFWNYIRGAIFPKTEQCLLDIWSAYSKPVPAGYKDLCLLLLVSLCIGISSGRLLFNWMFSSLQYTFQMSLTTSGIFSFFIFLLLALVHPARCILTISVPTLGTKQGRRLLLSSCFLIITFGIIPNIADNIKAILQFLKCISQNSSESILNSTAILEQSAREFGEQVTLVTLKLQNGGLTFFSKIDKSAVRNQMLQVGEKIREDYSVLKTMATEAVLMANRIIACFCVLSLLFQSAWYLKGYLTDLKFDNIYLTKKLEDLSTKSNMADIVNCNSKRLIKSLGWKLSKEEYLACVLRIVILSFFFAMIATTIVMDHVAFVLAVAIGDWADRFPIVPMTLEIKYNVEICFQPFILCNIGTISTNSFERKYQRDLTFVSNDCTLLPNAPNNTVAITVGLIYCTACALMFFQTYAHRLRRKISASFFEKQEDARIEYLFQAIQRDRQK